MRGRKSTIRLRAVLACAATPLFGVPTSQGAEDVRPPEAIDYTLRVGAAYSDNANRGYVFRDEAYSLIAGVELAGLKETGRLRYDLIAGLQHYEYLQSDLPGTNFGGAALSGSYELVEDTFSWNAALLYDQVRQDMFRALAPGNTESSVSWSTGPTVRLRLSDLTRAELDGHYARQDFSVRPYDNETVGGSVQLLRQSTPRTSFGVGYAYDDFSYVGGLGATTGLDFRRQEYFGSFNTRGVRTSFEARAGMANAKGQVVDDSTPMARVRLTRRLTPSVAAFVGYVREYPTSLATPMTHEEIVLAGLDDSVLLSSTPRIANSADVGLRYERERTNFSLTYFNRSEASLVASFGSRKAQELRGEIERRISPTATGTFYVSRSDERYTMFARHMKTTTAGAGFVRELGPRFGVEARVEYYSQTGVLVTDSIHELSAGVFLRYANHAARDADELR